MDNYIEVHCPECHNNYVGYIYRGEIDDDYKTCDECGAKNEFIKFDDIVDEDIILEIIGSELENANHHSMTSLPRDMFDAIAEFIEPQQYAEVARKIALTIYKTI